MSTILTTRNPNQEDLRVGVVKNFFIHTPQIRMDAASAADSITLELYQLPHAFANVYWYQDHPMKLCRFKNGIVMDIYDNGGPFISLNGWSIYGLLSWTFMT